MTDIPSDKLQWRQLVDKELKGQSIQDLGVKIADILLSSPLPVPTDLLASTSQNAGSFFVTELISAVGHAGKDVNKHILSGLARGAQEILVYGNELEENTLFEAVDQSIISSSIGHQQDNKGILFREFFGLMAKTNQPLFQSDIHILNSLIDFLEHQSDRNKVVLYIALREKFTENIVRLKAIEHCAHEIALLSDKKIALIVKPLFNITPSLGFEADIIKYSSIILSACLSGVRGLVYHFPLDYFENPWPEKYLRPLRSVPLLIQHESILFTDQTNMTRGSFYFEEHTLRYAQKLWNALKNTLKASSG